MYQYMEKRAQITLFVILGAVILIAVLFFVYLRSSLSESKSSQGIKQVLELPSEISPIKNFVDDCVQTTLTKAIELVSIQGGYYVPPTDSVSFSKVEIPLYYDLGSVWIPSKEVIEQQISAYVDDFLPHCTNGFDAFKKAGYTFKEGTVNSKTMISQQSVSITVSYPLDITKQDKKTTISDFQATAVSSLWQYYNYSNDIVAAMEEKPNFIPLSHIVSLGAQKGFDAELIYQNESSVIFSLIPVDTGINPSIYAFAARYDWNTKNIKKVSILAIPDQNATVGYKYAYKVRARGDNLSYIDYTRMFEINKSTGLISFVPAIKDKGLHRIMIKVTDDKGNQDSAFMTLNVAVENYPPKISPIPDQTATVGKLFAYSAKASDPDNDTIFFLLKKGPANMHVNTLSGEITFAPTPEQVGVHNVSIVAVDIKSATDKVNFQVTVK